MWICWYVLERGNTTYGISGEEEMKKNCEAKKKNAVITACRKLPRNGRLIEERPSKERKTESMCVHARAHARTQNFRSASSCAHGYVRIKGESATNAYIRAGISYV